jgi:hypothetical protein
VQKHCETLLLILGCRAKVVRLGYLVSAALIVAGVEIFVFGAVLPRPDSARAVSRRELGFNDKERLLEVGFQ